MKVWLEDQHFMKKGMRQAMRIKSGKTMKKTVM